MRERDVCVGALFWYNDKRARANLCDKASQMPPPGLRPLIHKFASNLQMKCMCTRLVDLSASMRRSGVMLRARLVTKY